MWAKRAQEERMDMFSLLSDILENTPQVKIIHSVSQHLSKLAEKFAECFPAMSERDTCGLWTHCQLISQKIMFCPHICEFSTDSTLKGQWGKLDLCESGFSIVATAKTKTRNRLRASLEATLRVSLSPLMFICHRFAVKEYFQLHFI